MFKLKIKLYNCLPRKISIFFHKFTKSAHLSEIIEMNEIKHSPVSTHWVQPQKTATSIDQARDHKSKSRLHEELHLLAIYYNNTILLNICMPDFMKCSNLQEMLARTQNERNIWKHINKNLTKIAEISAKREKREHKVNCLILSFCTIKSINKRSAILWLQIDT